jgi:hypothetical protein
VRACRYHGLYDGQRCIACERQRDQRRGTPTQRGYDTEHVNARAQLKLYLPGPCGYGCGRILSPDGDWVAAHAVDGDPAMGWLAACRSCNERAKRRPIDYDC